MNDPGASGRIARLQVLAAAFLFSTGGAAIKATALTSWQVASFRSLIAAAVLLAVGGRWRRRWTPRVIAVGLAYGSTLVLYVAATKLTTAANAIFLQSTAPLSLLVLSPLLLREPVHRRDVGFAAVMALGLALFFFESPRSLVTAPDPTTGNLLGAASGFTWALTILGLRWLAREPDDVSGAAVVSGNVIAGLACLPLALPVVDATPGDWSVIFYLGAFQIGLAYVWLTRGIAGLSAFEVSLLILLEPVLNGMLAWAIHGEVPSHLALAGCALILVATLARSLREGAPPPQPGS